MPIADLALESDLDWLGCEAMLSVPWFEPPEAPRVEAAGSLDGDAPARLD